MKRSRYLCKTKSMRPLAGNSRRSSTLTRAMLRKYMSITKSLEFDERIRLYQQLEIAQGIRKGVQTEQELSAPSKEILELYKTLGSKRERTLFAKRVKNQVYLSLKKSISEE